MRQARLSGLVEMMNLWLEKYGMDSTVVKAEIKDDHVNFYEEYELDENGELM